jgi:DNA-binding ferritin-like protein (Dps family)
VILPQGLYETITKKVVTMDHARKHVGAVQLFDTNLIYSRVIGLQASGQDIDIKDVLGHKLAPVPTSMFDDTGDMRIAKSKSTLKKI